MSAMLAAPRDCVAEQPARTPDQPLSEHNVGKPTVNTSGSLSESEKEQPQEVSNLNSTQQNARHSRSLQLHDPPPTPPPSGPPPLAPHQLVDSDEIEALRESGEWPLTTSFARNPRKAPAPPAKPVNSARDASVTLLHAVQANIPEAISLHEVVVPPSAPRQPSLTKHAAAADGSQSQQEIAAQQPEPRKSGKQKATKSDAGINAAEMLLMGHKAGKLSTSTSSSRSSGASFRSKKQKSRQLSTSTSSSRETVSSIETKTSAPSRSSTAPVETDHATATSPGCEKTPGRVRSAFSSPRVSVLKAAHANRLSARSSTSSGKVDKHGNAKSSTSSLFRAALFDIDEKKVPPESPILKNDVVDPGRPPTPPRSQTPTKRRNKKGETMSMLLDAGFFPVAELVYGTTKPTRPNSMLKYRINMPPRLSIEDGRELPDTPESIGTTPVEFYQYSPTTPRFGRPLSSNSSRPSPLAQVREIGPKESEEPKKAPRRESVKSLTNALAAIPEDAALVGTPAVESGAAEPKAVTQIRLRGGSIVTVTPPELTAWRPPVYKHGAIKLAKPALMPKKDSVASLEPFAAVIDQAYRNSSRIARRMSDDGRITDDICDFFEEFGFASISFAGDMFWMKEHNKENMIEEEDEAEEEGVRQAGGQEHDIERFSTPPADVPVASPIEKVFAQEIVATMGTPSIDIPPVETEETLRAKGIARLMSRGSLSSVAASERMGSDIALDRKRLSSTVPAPDITLFGGASRVELATGGDEEQSATDQGFDWDDDVEELDVAQNWTAPAALMRDPLGMSKKKTRNPVSRMRRMMATATAIL